MAWQLAISNITGLLAFHFLALARSSALLQKLQASCVNVVAAHNDNCLRWGQANCLKRLFFSNTYFQIGPDNDFRIDGIILMSPRTNSKYLTFACSPKYQWYVTLVSDMNELWFVQKVNFANQTCMPASSFLLVDYYHIVLFSDYKILCKIWTTVYSRRR